METDKKKRGMCLSTVYYNPVIPYLLSCLKKYLLCILILSFKNINVKCQDCMMPRTGCITELCKNQRHLPRWKFPGWK